MRLLWRTGEEGREAEPEVRLLIVLAVDLRVLLGSHERPCDYLGLQTRIEQRHVSKIWASWDRQVGGAGAMRTFKGLSISPSKAPSHAISTVEDAFLMAHVGGEALQPANLGSGAAPPQ